MAKNQSSSPAFLLITTALDTTWRMFVPIVGGLFAGIGLDQLLSIAPFATIMCLVLGVVLSGVLVVRQLSNVREAKK